MPTDYVTRLARFGILEKLIARKMQNTFRGFRDFRKLEKVESEVLAYWALEILEENGLLASIPPESDLMACEGCGAVWLKNGKPVVHYYDDEDCPIAAAEDNQR